MTIIQVDKNIVSYVGKETFPNKRIKFFQNDKYLNEYLLKNPQLITVNNMIQPHRINNPKSFQIIEIRGVTQYKWVMYVDMILSSREYYF